MTDENSPVTTIEVPKLRCMRCGHEWIPRNPDKLPKNCANPKCNSPYWDRPRRVKKSERINN